MNPMTIDMKCVPILNVMTKRGFLLDIEHFKRLSIEYHAKLDEIQAELDGFLGYRLNPASPLQVMAYISKNKIKGIDSRKIKDTGYETLKPIAGEYPAISLIQEYRKFDKLLGTYVDKLPVMCDAENRLHTTFSLTTAETARLSSKNPNCQNISSRSTEGAQVRKGFIASPGMRLLRADY